MVNLTYNSALNGSTLTITISGRVDSDNSRELSEYCATACQQAHETLALDLENLEYISSAGLRVLLVMLKKEPKPVKAVNVSSEVYEILEMTGFAQMLQTSRAMRRVSVEGCEKIGQGGQGSVYRLDKDTIIKVFSPQMPFEEVEKERNYAQQAFMLGLPTAISYDIVKCGGSLGVVYEMLNADTLAAVILKEPDKLEHMAKEYAKMARKAHSVDMAGTALPSVKAKRADGVQLALKNGGLTQEQASGCMRFYDSLPDRMTFIHGDFNPNNVMLLDGEMLLIDMGAAGFGHPMIDIASVYMTTGFPGKFGIRTDERVEGLSNALSPEQSLRLWEVFSREYFATLDQETLNSLDDHCETFTLLNLALIGSGGVELGLAREVVEVSKATGEALFFPELEERYARLDYRLWGDSGGRASEPERRSLLDKLLGKHRKQEAASAITIDSKIREIVENEAARAVLERHIPGMTGDKQLKMAYGMSLRAIQKFPQAGISKEQLTEIEQNFAAL